MIGPNEIVICTLDDNDKLIRMDSIWVLLILGNTIRFDGPYSLTPQKLCKVVYEQNCHGSPTVSLYHNLEPPSLFLQIFP